EIASIRKVPLALRERIGGMRHASVGIQNQQDDQPTLWLPAESVGVRHGTRKHVVCTVFQEVDDVQRRLIGSAQRGLKGVTDGEKKIGVVRLGALPDGRSRGE